MLVAIRSVGNLFDAFVGNASDRLNVEEKPRQWVPFEAPPLLGYPYGSSVQTEPNFCVHDNAARA